MRRRSTKAERIRRINRAVGLLRKWRSNSRVIVQLRREYGISRPQAYRYVKAAERAGNTLRVPEEKESLTVRLPVSVGRRVRRLKKRQKESISGVMAESLSVHLKRHGA